MSQQLPVAASIEAIQRDRRARLAKQLMRLSSKRLDEAGFSGPVSLVQPRLTESALRKRRGLQFSSPSVLSGKSAYANGKLNALP